MGGRGARRERDRHDRRRRPGSRSPSTCPSSTRSPGEPTARALYLYPTKALTQDQARSLARLRLEGLRPAIYDGDTEPERRPQIRKTANVILTNPDMLHVGILPNHDRWGDVLHNLRYVVVDEAHVYRGVFGSHVGNVLRRLRRLARAYGAEPQFLLASATIANPGELALALTGRPATVVDSDTSARARARRRALEPGAARPRARGARERALGGVAADVRARLARPAHDLLREEPQGGRADPPLHRRPGRHRDRRPARAVPRRLHARAAPRDRAAADGGRAARGLGDGRARARHRHRRARLRDLGRLPRHRRLAAPAVGPGRAPRPRPRGADRERGRARPVLHARARGAARAPGRGDAARSCEPADPRPARLRGRLRGADADRRTPPRSVPRRSSAPRCCPSSSGRPPDSSGRGATPPRAAFSLRSGGQDSFTIVDGTTGSILGLVERERAYSTVHEGAVYLHLGEQYLVRALDDGARTAVVEPAARRLVHAGEEGHRDRDRGAAAHRARAPASSSSSAASR